MKKFIDVLQEKPRTIAFTFGRFNPPTIGHGKLLDKLNSVRADDTFIYASHSQNPEKDPLQYVKKIAYMKQSFPKYAKNSVVSKARTVFEIVVEIQKKYNPANAETMSLIMVVGSDRVKEFKTLLNTYNGVESRHGYYKFKTIQVISAGQRDPDAQGATGMSASKIRAAAEMSDFKSFQQGTTLKGAQAKKLYFDVRKSMGIKEELDLSDFEVVRDLYLSEQIWNVGDLVVTNEGCGEIIRRGTNYVTIVKENYKVEKVWLHDIKIDENQKVKQDKDIKDYTSRFGIYLEGHQTQKNKYDPIYGVGSMQQLFEQKLINLPYGDTESETKSNIYRRQLIYFSSAASKASKAKSYKSDVVMASWFPLKVIRRLGKERLAEVGLDYKPSFGEWNISDMNESPWG